MAGTVEQHETMSLTLSVKKRWWVSPFMFAGFMVGLVLLPLIDVQRYSDAVADFIVRHGLRFSAD